MAAKRTAIFNIAAKAKMGKQLTDGERKLCTDNPELFSEYLQTDDLDSYFLNQPQTELNVKNDKEKLVYEETTSEIPLINAQVLPSLAVKIKSGQSLTTAEEKLCIDNFDNLSKLFTLEDLNKYFWTTKREAGERINKEIYKYWKDIYVELPQSEATPLTLNSEIEKQNTIPRQEAFSSSRNEENLNNVKSNGRIKSVTKPRTKAFEFDAAKVRGWIFVIIIFLMLVNLIFSGKRIGCECNDGTDSSAISNGACSHHGGVKHWKNKHLWD